MVFWGAEVKPGEPYIYNGDDEYDGDRLHLSQATLGLDGKSKDRTVVKCRVGLSPELLLCSLTPGVTETCSLDLLFDQDVAFSVTGSTSVHLVGYYIPLDGSDDADYSYDSLDEEDYALLSDEDDSDVDALPSSVTIEEVAGLLEDAPVKEGKKAAKRRKREAAAAAAGGATPGKAAEDDASEDDDGFPSKKKQAVNGGDGTPAPSPAPSSASKKKRKGRKKAAAVERVGNPDEAPAPAQKSDAEDAVMADEMSPAPTEKVVEQVKTPVKVPATINGSLPKTPAKTPAGNGAKATPGMDATKKSAKKTSSVRKFPNGLEIEELGMGKPDAKQTKLGKKVSMIYTGKLKSNGKIFDSNVGKKPFQFRLGVGDVIKGWDVGVRGMRVGDKRRITVPPVMGYGAKGVPGTIPGNSWLVFDVEVQDADSGEVTT